MTDTKKEWRTRQGRRMRPRLVMIRRKPVGQAVVVVAAAVICSREKRPPTHSLQPQKRKSELLVVTVQGRQS